MLNADNQTALAVCLTQKRAYPVKKVCVPVVDVYGFEAEVVSTVGVV